MTILWLDTVDSTNNEVSRKADTLDNLSVIAAREQTSGKGQRGNRWSSECGSNLTFSILLKDEALTLEASGQFAITQAVTLALTDYLADRGISAEIKWPNDIYAGEKKICGVLIENSLSGNRIRKSVIGIGLNVNQTEFPENLPNPTSMALESGKHYDTENELEMFLSCFEKYSSFPNDPQTRGELNRKYLQRMFRKDIPKKFLDIASGKEFTGIIRGTDETGELLVQMPDGSTRAFGFKEIGYIL